MNYAFTKACLDFYAFDKFSPKQMSDKLNEILMRNTDTVNLMMLNLLDSHDDPYRLDFFGDEIDSIRTFDIEDQLSKSRVENAEIVGLNSGKAALNSSEGAFNCAEGTFTQSTIVDYLTDDFIWVSNDFALSAFRYASKIHFDDRSSGELALPTNMKFAGTPLENRKTIELNEKSTFATHSRVNFETTPQPVFHKHWPEPY